MGALSVAGRHNAQAVLTILRSHKTEISCE
jgi:hypothetical protein